MGFSPSIFEGTGGHDIYRLNIQETLGEAEFCWVQLVDVYSCVPLICESRIVFRRHGKQGLGSLGYD